MLEVMSYNDRAIRCYEKCGFKEFGRRHQSVYMNGKYYDKSIYGSFKKKTLNAIILEIKIYKNNKRTFERCLEVIF